MVIVYMENGKKIPFPSANNVVEDGDKIKVCDAGRVLRTFYKIHIQGWEVK